MHRELDRLARRTRGRDDDDASGRRLGGNERVMVEWKVRVADPPLFAVQRPPCPRFWKGGFDGGCDFAPGLCGDACVAG
jgi:hypothetical protein